MAEVEKQKVTLRNAGKGARIFFDASGAQHTLGPGQELEVEMRKAEAERLKKQAEAGYGDISVDGTDPTKAKKQRLEEPVEEPEEQGSRQALSKKEAELMKAGQEGDKERREKVAKMTGEELAAETGIGILWRGVDALETVGAPADAEPEKKKPAKK